MYFLCLFSSWRTQKGEGNLIIMESQRKAQLGREEIIVTFTHRTLLKNSLGETLNFITKIVIYHFFIECPSLIGQCSKFYHSQLTIRTGCLNYLKSYEKAEYLLKLSKCGIDFNCNFLTLKLFKSIFRKIKKNSKKLFPRVLNVFKKKEIIVVCRFDGHYNNLLLLRMV